MNWQQCARTIFMGHGFSYESFYQAARRVWRFGQRRTVVAHVVMACTEAGIWDVVALKAAAHDDMKISMFEAARRNHAREHRKCVYETKRVQLQTFEEAP